MPNVNEFSEAMKAIRHEIDESKDRAEKTKVVPFGLERLTKPEYVGRRFEQMSKQERKEHIQRVGVEQVMKQIRAARGTNG